MMMNQEQVKINMEKAMDDFNAYSDETISSLIERETQYLTRKDLLEEDRMTQHIIETPLSVFDLIIVQEKDGLVGFFLHRIFSNAIDHTKTKQMRVAGNTLYIYPYIDEQEIREDCKLYEFTDENIEQVVTYTNLRDEIINPIANYMGRDMLGYANCRVGIESDGNRFLEIKLLDDEGKIPIGSNTISKDILRNENCIGNYIIGGDQ